MVIADARDGRKMIRVSKRRSADGYCAVQSWARDDWEKTEVNVVWRSCM